MNSIVMSILQSGWPILVNFWINMYLYLFFAISKSVFNCDNYYITQQPLYEYNDLYIKRCKISWWCDIWRGHLHIWSAAAFIISFMIITKIGRSQNMSACHIWCVIMTSFHVESGSEVRILILLPCQVYSLICPGR